MTPIVTLALAVICGLLAWAVWSDTRVHRIPNWLVVAVLCAGFIVQVFSNGAMGILTWLGGAAVGTAVFLPFYIGRGMGAGDVKLMGAVGSTLGPWGAVIACCLTLMAGLWIVLLAIGWRSIQMQMALWRTAESKPVLAGNPFFLVWKDNATRIPYAAAIATGGIVGLWQFDYLQPLISAVT